jgi:hypothetical protein
MFAILIGPGGMFEQRPAPPPAVVTADDELVAELHAARPKASAAPTAMGRNR